MLPLIIHPLFAARTHILDGTVLRTSAWALRPGRLDMKWQFYSSVWLLSESAKPPTQIARGRQWLAVVDMQITQGYCIANLLRNIVWGRGGHWGKDASHTFQSKRALAPKMKTHVISDTHNFRSGSHARSSHAEHASLPGLLLLLKRPLRLSTKIPNKCQVSSAAKF